MPADSIARSAGKSQTIKVLLPQDGHHHHSLAFWGDLFLLFFCTLLLAEMVDDVAS